MEPYDTFSRFSFEMSIQADFSWFLDFPNLLSQKKKKYTDKFSCLSQQQLERGGKAEMLLVVTL